ANSGAISSADSTSGNTGDAHNKVRGRAFGGDGGRGGDFNGAEAGNGGTAGTGAITVSGKNAHVDVVTRGGDAIAQLEANGGNGGAANLTEDPVAWSGNSGTAWAQSSATNTGNTGPATSTADANPQA